LTVFYSSVDGHPGVLLGGEGALLLDHSLSIGVAAFGWTRDDVYGPDDALGDPRKLRFGYGGGVVRYAWKTGYPLYPSFGVLIGAGALGLQHRWDDEVRRDDTDRFFVLEPQAQLHLNITRWMRAGLQLGYRVTSGVAKFDYTESDFDGLTLGGNLQFGWL